ncbi:(2Fe-2S)-binding protein [Kordiimonas sp.]|uniref:(2Fe-2S)-binding protein n=1 Tax=Kordiimonas sp. TaxID=1970157 RepID=UPI003A8F12FB
MAKRVTDHVTRSGQVTVHLNGKDVTAYEGETVAAVLMLSAGRATGVDPLGKPRAPFCNMGVCYDCMVDIAASGDVSRSRKLRACMTPVTDGMVVVTSAPEVKKP